MTEDANSPSQADIDWSAVLGALRQGSTPDGSASLDAGEHLCHLYTCCPAASCLAQEPLTGDIRHTRMARNSNVRGVCVQ